MSAPKSTEPLTSNKRFIPLVQSKGSLGKSFFGGLLLEYYQYAGIPFKAVDSDVVHQSLKSRYPDHTNKFDASKNQDLFGVMLDRLPDSPVVLLDCRANFTLDFLECCAHYRLLDIFERKGFRTTLPIFISDDEDARRSAADLVTYFGDAADYVMVDNPKNFGSNEFRRTGLYKWLLERDAPLITMPEMHTVTKNCWEEIEDKAGDHLSISKVIEHKECSDVAYFELSGVKDLMFRQFEDSSKYLLPDPGLIKQKVTRVDLAAAKPAKQPFKSSLVAKS
jgi:hypothetical protein